MPGWFRKTPRAFEALRLLFSEEELQLLDDPPVDDAEARQPTKIYIYIHMYIYIYTLYIYTYVYIIYIYNMQDGPLPGPPTSAKR